MPANTFGEACCPAVIELYSRSRSLARDANFIAPWELSGGSMRQSRCVMSSRNQESAHRIAPRASHSARWPAVSARSIRWAVVRRFVRALSFVVGALSILGTGGTARAQPFNYAED